MPLQPEKLDCETERLFDELEALRQNAILLQECVSFSRNKNERTLYKQYSTYGTDVKANFIFKKAKRNCMGQSSKYGIFGRQPCLHD